MSLNKESIRKVDSREHSQLLPQNAWQVSITAIILLLLLTLFLYQQTFSYLIGIWNQLETGNYAHGYLVLLISGYLIYDKRSQLQRLIPNVEYSAIIILIPAALLWMAAALTNVEVIQSVALLMLIMAIVWASFGTQVSQVLAFPILYIVFAIPIWFPLSPVLQNLTADVVFWLVRLIEIPASREENMITLPAGRLSIEEACSGLRYVLAALTLGTLYAYLNYQTLRSRIIVVLISAGAALLANIIRVFVIVYLAYETDMQHPLVTEHLTFGWYLFSGLIFVLLVIDIWMHKPEVQLDELSDPTKEGYASNKSKQSLFFVALVAVLVSAGPLMIMWSNDQDQSKKISYENLLSSINPAISNESVERDTVDDWVPEYHGADNYKLVYQDDNYRKMHLFLGVYLAQRQGRELINDLNNISDGKIWRRIYQREKSHNIGGEPEQQILEQLLVKTDGTKRLVWYWYRVAGQNTVNKYMAKVLQLKGTLKGSKRAAVIAIATNLESDVESARSRINQFIIERQSSINSILDGGS